MWKLYIKPPQYTRFRPATLSEQGISVCSYLRAQIFDSRAKTEAQNTVASLPFPYEWRPLSKNPKPETYPLTYVNRDPPPDGRAYVVAHYRGQGIVMGQDVVGRLIYSRQGGRKLYYHINRVCRLIDALLAGIDIKTGKPLAPSKNVMSRNVRTGHGYGTLSRHGS